MLNLPKLFILALSLRALSSPLNSDTTDTTIIPIIEPICDQKYHDQQKEMEFFLEEIIKAFDIEVPKDVSDSLNHK